MTHKINFFQILKNLFIENKIFVYLVIILGIFTLGAFNYSFILLKSVDLWIEQNFVPIIYSIIYLHTLQLVLQQEYYQIRKEKVLISGFPLFAISALLIYFSEKSNIIYILFQFH